MKTKEATTIRVTLRGHPFVVYLFPFKDVPKGTHGGCTTRRRKPGRIYVVDELPPDRLMETMIHEMLHGWFDRRLSEKDVTHLGRDLCRSLRRMGFGHGSEFVPHPHRKERKVKCPHCAGTGCNKRLPRLTAGMWAACDKCRGSGFDLKKCGVGPHVPVSLIAPCRCFTPTERSGHEQGD